VVIRGISNPFVLDFKSKTEFESGEVVLIPTWAIKEKEKNNRVRSGKRVFILFIFYNFQRCIKNLRGLAKK
jgi:hypothetical protein